MVDWTKKSILPTKDLLAWYQHVPGVSTNSTVHDSLVSARDLVADGGSHPVITLNLANGEAGWYFDGTRNSLVWSGSVTVKRLFVVAAFEDATFGVNRGLFSGASSGDALTSDNTGTKLFTFGTLYDYRLNGLTYADFEWEAPVSSRIGLIDLSHSTGLNLDGMRVGQQKTDTARKLKGFFLHALPYAEQPNELAEYRIYQYHAMRFHLWQRHSSGLWIFPFAANRTSSLENDRETYLTESYEGDVSGLVRGNYADGMSLPFLLREQEEFLAAKAFRQQHGRLTPFIYRDYRYYPYRETTVRFTSPIREQGSDTSYRFNYSFDVVETPASGNYWDGGPGLDEGLEDGGGS